MDQAYSYIYIYIYSNYVNIVIFELWTLVGNAGATSRTSTHYSQTSLASGSERSS